MSSVFSSPRPVSSLGWPFLTGLVPLYHDGTVSVFGGGIEFVSPGRAFSGCVGVVVFDRSRPSVPRWYGVGFWRWDLKTWSRKRYPHADFFLHHKERCT